MKVFFYWLNIASGSFQVTVAADIVHTHCLPIVCAFVSVAVAMGNFSAAYFVATTRYP